MVTIFDFAAVQRSIASAPSTVRLEISYFHEWGVPPPIRDLIFQPFPNFMEGKKEHKLWFTFLIGIGKH